MQAPMANVAGVDLAVAAAESGALGSLPCGMITGDRIREQVADFRLRTQGPLNLNFFCFDMPDAADDSAWRAVLEPYYEEFGIPHPPAAALRVPFGEEHCAIIEELKPEVVSFHFGLPDQPLLDRVRATRTIILACATSLDEAVWLQFKGADVIIAQGFEAGGHRGSFLGGNPQEALGLFALLPQIVDTISIPVIAAGAVADARGIAAAFALGACGVQVGTAFLQCPESFLPEGHKKVMRERATLLTNIYSGGIARASRGRLIDEIGPVRSEAPPYPLAGAVTLPLFRAAIERGDYEFLPSLAGQNAALGHPVPAAELIRDLAADTLAILGKRV